MRSMPFGMQSADLPGQLLDQSLLDRSLPLAKEEAVLPWLLNRRRYLLLKATEGSLHDLQCLKEGSSHQCVAL